MSTKIMGISKCRTQQMADFLLQNNPNPNITCTVNEFFKPQNTTRSVKGFIKMIRNAEIFKTIEKSKKDYSEKFHPYILAGGFGTRLEVISHAKSDNKPSTVTPIPGWKLIHFSLLNLYQANLLNEKTKIDSSFSICHYNHIAFTE